jgi:hypothetical protein
MVLERNIRPQLLGIYTRNVPKILICHFEIFVLINISYIFLSQLFSNFIAAQPQTQIKKTEVYLSLYIIPGSWVIWTHFANLVW